MLFTQALKNALCYLLKVFDAILLAQLIEVVVHELSIIVMCAITRRYNRISPLEAKQEPFLWIVVNLRVDLRLKTSLYQLHDVQISCQFSLTFSEDFDIRF